MASGKILLTGVSPSIEGRCWQSEQVMRIGRHTQMDIVINDPTLSRQHTEIRLSPKGWLVQDLGSSSGTFLNGVLTGKTTRQLQSEDVLQCGNLVFKVLQLAWQPSAFAPARSKEIKTAGPLVRVQTLAPLSWEQRLRRVEADDSQLPHGKQFLKLLRAGFHLSRVDSLNELLQSVLDDTVAVLNAQRGTIALVDESTGSLILRTQSGKANGNQAFSRTLALRCFSKGESLLCLDAGQESPGLVQADGVSIICALLRSPRRRLGVLHLDRPAPQTPFSDDEFKLADNIAATVSVGIESALGVEKQHEQLLQEVLELMHETLANRDAATAQHCRRVGTLALHLADELGLTAAEKTQVKLGALLHDIGKIGWSDGLLRQIPDVPPGEPTRDHPLHGVAIAEKVSAFAPALPIIRSHHECWDGSGYPDGLRGEQIPRLARLVAVADALDNSLYDGLPRSARSLAEALANIQADAGRRFDPAIVAVLPALRRHLNEV